ncbi:MAG TPA: 7,8-didemethyl-8-hydroxy-5-deazariboflavin synthase subunit CofG, partial [Alphaproteobacteria bacterium]|nr:7,8-didemethyl-8-hydroxy-5-deazariboflavin synthase subunit CofG [Alphaproteobacteria bacterium]
MSADALRHLARELDLSELIVRASVLRDQGHGTIQTFSPKVFIPLTHLCRDVCHYCTFAKPPRQGEAAYLTPDEVLSIAREGALAGCHEALFTLGDKPELRYQVAREQLALLGHENTISYLVEMCELVLKETGLLPHANPGVLAADEIAALRRVTTSQGIMLESAAKRLCQHGGPHFGSPDKEPAVRLETIRSAGEQAVPITSGILIGIGETREERIDALLALRSLHLEHGHIQEIIIQNFRAKPDTKMADAPEPDLNELMWTIAIARIAFGSTMNIQAPPNLSPNVFGRLIEAGINDWGGVSPVTLDHVNPEAPWPEVGMLAEATKEAGKTLVPRLAIYPEYVKNLERWQDDGVACHVRHVADADGFARPEAWSPGSLNPVPSNNVTDGPFVAESYGQIESILNRACDGIRLEEGDIARMFRARGEEVDLISQTADDLRRATVGNVVRYVVNRNINYTNVCYFRCQFCAFSKGKLSENLRGAPYDLALDEVTRRVQEAWERGATEVCMQGGIHPDYTGDTYLEICRAVRATVPDM